MAALGTFKARGIFCPLFSAFGPEPIEARLTIGQPKVLVTTDVLYRRKVEALRGRLPSLQHVLILAEDGGPADLPGTADLRRLMAGAAGRPGGPGSWKTRWCRGRW